MQRNGLCRTEATTNSMSFKIGTRTVQSVDVMMITSVRASAICTTQVIIEILSYIFEQQKVKPSHLDL